jgi:hypothetical protein
MSTSGNFSTNPNLSADRQVPGANLSLRQEHLNNSSTTNSSLHLKKKKKDQKKKLNPAKQKAKAKKATIRLTNMTTKSKKN